MGIFGGSSKDDLEIKVTVETKEATEQAKKLEDSLGKLGQKGRESGQGLGVLDSSLAKTALGFVSVGAAVAGFNATLARGVQVENLGRGFDSLQSSIGRTPDSINKFREATLGLVSDLDLMQSANQAVLLGVDKGSDAFIELTGDAIKLGRAMGIDAKNSIDSLVVGIGRGSKLVLDNLGIIVNTEQAYRRFAASINTTADKLSDSQKQLAFQAAAMDSIKEKVGGLPNVLLNAGDAYTQLKNSAANAFDEFARGAVQNLNLASAIRELGGDLKKLDFKTIGGQAGDFAAGIIRVGTAVNSFFIPIINSASQAMKGMELTFRTISNISNGQSLTRGFTNAAKDMLDLDTATNKVAKGTENLSRLLSETTTKSGLQTFVKEVNVEIDKLVKSTSSTDSLVKNQIDLKYLTALQTLSGQATGKLLNLNKALSGTGEEAGKAGKKAYELVNITQMLNGKLLSDDLKNHVKELSEGFKDGTVKMDQMDSMLETLRKGFVNMGLTAQEVDSIFKGIDLTSKPKETLEAYFKLQVQQDKLKLSVKDISRQYQDHNIDLGEATKKLIGLSDEYVKLGLTVEQADSIIKGADFTAPLKDNLLNQIPDFLGKMITQSITDGLENGLNAETLKGLGSSVASIFANEFQANFSKVFAKDAAGNLTGGIDFGALGSSAASLGMAYGVSSLTQNLSDNKKDPQGGIIGGAVLGASYGSTFGPYGALIGGVVGAGAGYVAGTTGKSTEEGSVSRKETVNWIEDRINNLYLPFLKEQGNIILGDNRRFSENTSGGWFTQGMRYVDETAYRLGEGALGSDTRLGAGGYVHGERYDPVPGQIEGGDWATKYWDKFGQEGGNTFQALAAAMQNFSGQTTEEMGKIAVVIAENLNGNLDNARLLLQTMGVSAEDLTTAFMNIGLAGEETWLTVEGFFQKIPALTGEGLIGLGDVAGALNQIDDAAGRGGAALIGLTNAAIEVQEAGGKSLDDFRTMLLGTGKSAKDVDIIMQALAQRGVNSLDDLRNAGDRTLGGITADMDALGYTFSDSMTEGTDAAIAELEKLQKAVKDIPQDTEKNLTINVKTKYSDDQAKGALNQINGGSSGLGIARQ